MPTLPQSYITFPQSVNIFSSLISPLVGGRLAVTGGVPVRSGVLAPSPLVPIACFRHVGRDANHTLSYMTFPETSIKIFPLSSLLSEAMIEVTGGLGAMFV